VDINVFIDDLEYLADLKETVLTGYGRPYLIVPWKVVQELDNLKDSKNVKLTKERVLLKKNAKKAVYTLNTWLECRHSQIVGQNPAQAEIPVPDIKVETSDDWILVCCVQFRDKYPECHVVLLTRDRIVRNKAIFMQLDCFDVESMTEWVATQSMVSGNQHEVEEASPYLEPVQCSDQSSSATSSRPLKRHLNMDVSPAKKIMCA
jgi:predicted ribonuclease YlaK